MDVEQAIGEQLKRWGFSVEKIPESPMPKDRRPDYKARDDESTYLIEVKSRKDDPSQTEQRNEVLSRGEIYGEHKALIRQNTISGSIRDAFLQLKDYGEVDWFRIPWLCAIDRAQQAKYEQFKAALYGKTQMFDLDGDGYHRPCYFFRNSEFFRYRDVLDAAVVSTLREATLCLNPHSAKFSIIQSSKLVGKFGAAVCNPVEEEAAGDAYIVDSAVDRNDEGAVMGYLREKYQIQRLCSIDMGWHSATVLYPSGTYEQG